MCESLSPIYVLFLLKMMMLMTGVGSIELTAITGLYKSYLKRLYLFDWNSDPPSRMDPATADAVSRLRICENISRSSAFESDSSVHSVDAREVYDELQRPQYSDIFHQIYGLHPLHQYGNLFTSREFRIRIRTLNEPSTYVSADKSEYVFTCLLRKVDRSEEDSSKMDVRESDSGEKKGIILAFYVSKMYNIHRGLHARRFILLSNRTTEHYDILLMEQSAKPYLKPDFNVELHYLQLRKYSLPATRAREDPICNLNMTPNSRKALIRLCNIVLASPYFENQIASVLNYIYDGCSSKEIGFKTDEAVELAAEASTPFREYTVRCYAIMPDGGRKKFHISRAYNPYQVFVYVKNLRDGKLYLEVLLTDVSIVHELYNFHQVEI